MQQVRPPGGPPDCTERPVSDPATSDRVEEHAVFFTTAQGDPAAERYADLPAALRRVEALCNDEGIQDATVFGLVPVPLRVRSYFRVEVGAGEPADGAGGPDSPSPVASGEVRDALLEAVDASATGTDGAPAEESSSGGADDHEGAADDVLPSRGRNLGFFTH